jgi:hypothetical protein
MPAGIDKRIYTGQSMAGTFAFGDQLIIEKVLPGNVRTGDILIYRAVDQKGLSDEVVHRVIGSTPDGLMVQGDNNLHPDGTRVNEQNLVGRVTHVEREGKRHRIQCRRSGLLIARFSHGWLNVRRILWRSVRATGRKSYYWLRESGLISRLWRPNVVKVRLLTPGGPMIKYIWRNRTVASHWLNEGRFRCRKPYDLVMGSKEKPVDRDSYHIFGRR